jgi:hypothetical protein
VGLCPRGLVDDAVLVHATRNEVWSKPELVTGSFELRRITIREASYAEKRRFDFLEFYRARRMQGHTLGGLLRWTLKLFLRAPSQVPKRLFLWNREKCRRYASRTSSRRASPPAEPQVR